MKTWLLFPLALAACTHETTSGPGGPTAGLGSPISTESLSATTRAQICGPVPDALPDLAPEPDGYVPLYTDSCWLVDQAVGGDKACCGGDLQTQTCDYGWQCFHPGGSDIGECLLNPKLESNATALCISPTKWSGGCELDAINNELLDSTDPTSIGCELKDECGPYGGQWLSCAQGTCSCRSETGVSSFPEDGLCSGSLKAALAVAQARCNFPSSFPGGRYTNPWQ
jgi:hypothetical protein